MSRKMHGLKDHLFIRDKQKNEIRKMTATEVSHLDEMVEAIQDIYGSTGVSISPQECHEIINFNRSPRRAELLEDEMAEHGSFSTTIYIHEIIEEKCGNCKYVVDDDTLPIEDMRCHCDPPNLDGWALVRSTAHACRNFQRSESAYDAAKARLEQVKADLLQ